MEVEAASRTSGEMLPAVVTSSPIIHYPTSYLHAGLDIGYVPAGPHAFFRSSGHNNSFYAGPRGQWLSDRWQTHVPVFSVDVSCAAVRWFDLQVFSSTELFYLCVLV